MNKFRVLAAIAAGFVASPAAAAVTYELTSDSTSAVFTVPTFLTGSGTLNVSALDSCRPISGFTCSSVSYADNTALGDQLSIRSTFSNQTAINSFIFDASAFGAFGTYQAISNRSTLVVSESNGAVPEPATWAMMVVGFGAVGCGMRRKRTRTRLTYA